MMISSRQGKLADPAAADAHQRIVNVPNSMLDDRGINNNQDYEDDDDDDDDDASDLCSLATLSSEVSVSSSLMAPLDDGDDDIDGADDDGLKNNVTKQTKRMDGGDLTLRSKSPFSSATSATDSVMSSGGSTCDSSGGGGSGGGDEDVRGRLSMVKRLLRDVEEISCSTSHQSGASSSLDHSHNAASLSASRRRRRKGLMKEIDLLSELLSSALQVEAPAQENDSSAPTTRSVATTKEVRFQLHQSLPGTARELCDLGVCPEGDESQEGDGEGQRQRLNALYGRSSSSDDTERMLRRLVAENDHNHDNAAHNNPKGAATGGAPIFMDKVNSLREQTAAILPPSPKTQLKLRMLRFQTSKRQVGVCPETKLPYLPPLPPPPGRMAVMLADEKKAALLLSDVPFNENESRIIVPRGETKLSASDTVLNYVPRNDNESRTAAVERGMRSTRPSCQKLSRSEALLNYDSRPRTTRFVSAHCKIEPRGAAVTTTSCREGLIRSDTALSLPTGSNRKTMTASERSAKERNSNGAHSSSRSRAPDPPGSRSEKRGARSKTTEQTEQQSKSTENKSEATAAARITRERSKSEGDHGQTLGGSRRKATENKSEAAAAPLVVRKSPPPPVSREDGYRDKASCRPKAAPGVVAENSKAPRPPKVGNSSSDHDVSALSLFSFPDENKKNEVFKAASPEGRHPPKDERPQKETQGRKSRYPDKDTGRRADSTSKQQKRPPQHPAEFRGSADPSSSSHDRRRRDRGCRGTSSMSPSVHDITQAGRALKKMEKGHKNRDLERKERGARGRSGRGSGGGAPAGLMSQF